MSSFDPLLIDRFNQQTFLADAAERATFPVGFTGLEKVIHQAFGVQSIHDHDQTLVAIDLEAAQIVAGGQQVIERRLHHAMILRKTVAERIRILTSKGVARMAHADSVSGVGLPILEKVHELA